MDKNELKEIRKQKFAQMEHGLKEMHPKEEDSMFYYHPSEERIVLSHALFWTMTQPQCLKGKIRKERLPSVTTFSPRDSLSKLSSPLGLPKEFALMEQKLKEIHPKEESRLFYHHSSEDRVVLSHALFWTMTLPQNFKSKIRKEKFFLLLRQYQEEMLDAFLMISTTIIIR